MDYREAFEQEMAAEDFEFAARLVGKYSAHALAAGHPLLDEAPVVADLRFLTLLAAVTRWIAAQAETSVPAWALAVEPSPEPIYIGELYGTVGEPMKRLIRRDTPGRLATMNVWVRERDLRGIPA